MKCTQINEPTTKLLRYIKQIQPIAKNKNKKQLNNWKDEGKENCTGK